MASRAERYKKAAVKAAKKARMWAVVAVCLNNRLLVEAQKRVETEQRRKRVKAALRRTGKVMRAVGRAAIVAGVAAGLVGARGERCAPDAGTKGRRHDGGSGPASMR